jgi:hypothetical protein
MQYIIKIYETNTYQHNSLDDALGIMLGFSMDIKNISNGSGGIDYVIVDSEPSKIKRFQDMCRNYMSEWDRRWGLEELKKELANGKINQKKFDQKLNFISPSDTTVTLVLAGLGYTRIVTPFLHQSHV